CASVQASSRSISAALGLGLPAGGMSPERRFWATASQSLGSLRASASVLKRSSEIEPLGRLPPWQVVQYFARMGAISLSKLGVAWALAVGVVWPGASSARGAARVKRKAATRDEPRRR